MAQEDRLTPAIVSVEDFARTRERVLDRLLRLLEAGRLDRE
jgi:hypothetical protein